MNKTQRIIRPESHQIDTRAMHKVACALPLSWESRNLDGRDYGIDMMVEIFDQGVATGKYLLFQIKGTNNDISSNVRRLFFDFPVKTLKYSELFIVPFFLVICPIKADPPQFWYVWLQEYIRIVLDHDNPKWRDLKSKVRLTLPIDNTIPSNEMHLSYVANHPRRLFDWGQVGRIQHELKWLTAAAPRIALDDFDRILIMFEEAVKLPGIFADPNYRSAQLLRQNYIEPGIAAARLLLRGSPYNDDELISSGINTKSEDDETDSFLLQSQVKNVADMMSTFISTANDYALKRTTWECCSDHDF